MKNTVQRASTRKSFPAANCESWLHTQFQESTRIEESVRCWFSPALLWISPPKHSDSPPKFGCYRQILGLFCWCSTAMKNNIMITMVFCASIALHWLSSFKHFSWFISGRASFWGDTYTVRKLKVILRAKIRKCVPTKNVEKRSVTHKHLFVFCVVPSEKCANYLFSHNRVQVLVKIWHDIPRRLKRGHCWQEIIVPESFDGRQDQVLKVKRQVVRVWTITCAEEGGFCTIPAVALLQVLSCSL